MFLWSSELARVLTKGDCMKPSKIKMPKLSLSPNGPTQFSQLSTDYQRSIPFETIAWDQHEPSVNVQLFLVEPIQPASQLGQISNKAVRWI